MGVGLCGPVGGLVYRVCAGWAAVDLSVWGEDDFGSGVNVEVSGVELTVDGEGVDVHSATACTYPFDGVMFGGLFVAVVDSSKFGDVLRVRNELVDLLLVCVALLLFVLRCSLIDSVGDWSSEEVGGQLAVVPVSDAHERIGSLRNGKSDGCAGVVFDFGE